MYTDVPIKQVIHSRLGSFVIRSRKLEHKSYSVQNSFSFFSLTLGRSWPIVPPHPCAQKRPVGNDWDNRETTICSLLIKIYRWKMSRRRVKKKKKNIEEAMFLLSRSSFLQDFSLLKLTAILSRIRFILIVHRVADKSFLSFSVNLRIFPDFPWNGFSDFQRDDHKHRINRNESARQCDGSLWAVDILTGSIISSDSRFLSSSIFFFLFFLFLHLKRNRSYCDEGVTPLERGIGEKGPLRLRFFRVQDQEQIYGLGIHVLCGTQVRASLLFSHLLARP